MGSVKKRILCLEFAGDRLVTDYFEQALRDNGFEVEVLQATTVDLAWAEFDLIIQFGLSPRALAGEAYLCRLRGMLPGAHLMLVSGHYAQEVERIAVLYQAAFFQRDGDVKDFVSLVRSIAHPAIT